VDVRTYVNKTTCAVWGGGCHPALHLDDWLIKTARFWVVEKRRFWTEGGLLISDYFLWWWVFFWVPLSQLSCSSVCLSVCLSVCYALFYPDHCMVKFLTKTAAKAATGHRTPVVCLGVQPSTNWPDTKLNLGDQIWI